VTFRRPWLLTVALALAVALGTAGFAGCASASHDDDAAPAASAVEEPEHQDVTLRVAAPASLQGLIEDLASSYAADKDWLTFDITGYASAKKENVAIAPIEVDVAEELATLAPDEDAAPDTGDDDAPHTLPAAEIVFHSSLTAMDNAEDAGVADPKTRVDLLQEGLCIVVSSDSKLNAVSTADIAAGSHPLARMTGEGAYAKRQDEALEAIGVLEGGKPTGYYASNKGSLKSYDSVSTLFKAVSAGEDLVAIVKTGDLYRYGGVKVVGAIPARMYTPLVYPQALGVNIAGLENGEQVDEAARSFLTWISTDEAALRIVEKWGYSFRAA